MAKPATAAPAARATASARLGIRALDKHGNNVLAVAQKKRQHDAIKFLSEKLGLQVAEEPADAGLPPAPILAPGFGFQGAQPGDLGAAFGDSAQTVIASESRSLLSAGPGRLAETIRDRSEHYRSRE